MQFKKMKAAPAVKTPFLMVWQKGGPAPKIVRYLVWWAFLTEAANNHTSVVMKNIQQVMKRINAQALEYPGFKAFPQQKHWLETIMCS